MTRGSTKQKYMVHAHAYNGLAALPDNPVSQAVRGCRGRREKLLRELWDVDRELAALQRFEFALRLQPRKYHSMYHPHFTVAEVAAYVIAQAGRPLNSAEIRAQIHTVVPPDVRIGWPTPHSIGLGTHLYQHLHHNAAPLLQQRPKPTHGRGSGHTRFLWDLSEAGCRWVAGVRSMGKYQ